MDAAAHQVVHQVVAVGDAVEHVVDQPLLVLERHRPLAEMGGFDCVMCHGSRLAVSDLAGTIAKRHAVCHWRKAAQA